MSRHAGHVSTLLGLAIARHTAKTKPTASATNETPVFRETAPPMAPVPIIANTIGTLQGQRTIAASTQGQLRVTGCV